LGSGLAWSFTQQNRYLTCVRAAHQPGLAGEQSSICLLPGMSLLKEEAYTLKLFTSGAFFIFNYIFMCEEALK
jgi:hypothetical protein